MECVSERDIANVDAFMQANRDMIQRMIKTYQAKNRVFSLNPLDKEKEKDRFVRFVKDWKDEHFAEFVSIDSGPAFYSETSSL